MTVHFLKAIGEYIEMVKNGVKNRDKIIEAMRVSARVKAKRDMEDEQGVAIDENSIIISDEAVAEIMRRKDICATCPFNSRIRAEKNGYESSLPFEHCTLCKCRIGYEDSKEYCLSCECGAVAWNEGHPLLKPKEVKWTAFNETTNKN